MRRWAIGLGCALLATVACKRTPPRGLERPAELELFSWWTAEGERQALDALLGAHRTRRPNVQLANIAVPNRAVDPERVLNWRMGLDDRGLPDNRIIAHPPELVQWDLYDLKGRWLDKGIRFAPLDALYASEGWQGKLYDFLERDLKPGGHYLGLPVGLHRENSIVFNRKLLRTLGISESAVQSWDGLMGACETVKRAGHTCLALTQENWVNAIVFRVVAVATMGRDRFRAFFGRRGPRDEPGLAAAVTAYKALFDRGYAGGWDNQRRVAVKQWGWDHVRKSAWSDAARDVHEGKAAFFIHGDWSVGLLKALGWTSADLGVAAAPGTEGLFLLGADGFLIPEGSDDRDLALDVLRTWGQPAVLAAFSKAKGSTPPRPDVDLSDDPLAAAVASDLKGAAVIMAPPIFLPADVDLLEHVAGKKSLEGAVSALRQAVYPQ
jgi:glucose/mannose transport system substrate-binding protein